MEINNSKFKVVFRSVLAAGFFIFIFCVRFSMLQKSSEPNGLDGYFYALQAKSFVQTGQLENPSMEPGYYLCGICSFFAGDAVTGVKIWSALSSAGISFAVFILVYYLTGNTLISLFAFLLSGASPTLSVFGINYINNQTGLFFLLLYASSLVVLNKTEYSFNRKTCILIVISAVLFVLSCLCHKVSMIFALLLTFFEILHRGFLIFREKKSYFQIKNPVLKRFLIISAVLIFLTVCFFVICFLALHSPRFLHAFDLPSLPLLYKKFLNEVDLGAVEMTIYAPLLYILALFMLIKKIPGRSLVFFVSFVYFPFWNLSSDMGLRMWMNAVPLGIPLILYFIYKLFPLDSSKKIKKFAVRFVLFCLSGFLIWFTFSVTPSFYEPKNDPPYAYYKKIVHQISDLPQDSLLIAHLGLNHVYTYENNLKDGLNWLPDFEIAPEKTWRLAYGANEARIREILVKSGVIYERKNLLQPIDRNYILIRENLWQQYLANEDENIAETFKNWYNPYEIRPQYIRKSK